MCRYVGMWVRGCVCVCRFECTCVFVCVRVWVEVRVCRCVSVGLGA